MERNNNSNNNSNKINPKLDSYEILLILII